MSDEVKPPAYVGGTVTGYTHYPRDPALPKPHANQHRFDGLMAETLRHLDYSLGGFSQTTHGMRFDGTLAAVAKELLAAAETPSAFNISNLSQAIRDYLRANK